MLSKRARSSLSSPAAHHGARETVTQDVELALLFANIAAAAGLEAG